MSIALILLILVCLAGFYMAWSIGANDVANAMGTSVGSNALTLKQAVMIAAVLEFLGAFFFGSHVSETVQRGIIDPDVFADHQMDFIYGMLASLLATGAWLQLASYFGWPVSTTHSIVGALVGFGAIIGGVSAIYWGNIAFIVTSWILSPLLGGAVAFLIFKLLREKIFYKTDPIKAACRISPYLLFFVFTVLSLMFFFKGMANVPGELSFFPSLLISLCIGASAALVGYFFVKRLKFSQQPKEQLPYDIHVIRSLNKAKKHLRRAHVSAQTEFQSEISPLLRSTEELCQTLKTPEQLEYLHSEFTGVEKIFSYLQIVTACLMAFAHGANDVANAIGPIAATMSMLKTGTIPSSSTISPWILLLGGSGIVLGLATWGWRVIETIGKKITELTPSRGFAAEFGAALTILVASRLGLPISTTHTLVGAVIGVGLARGIEALNLNTTRDIVISWLVTIPAGAGITIVFFYAIKAVFG